MLAVEEAYAGYTGTDVIRGVSVQLEAGECVAVLGPNGAGKSTLLRLITGQIGLRSGRRTIDGTDATNWRPHRIARARLRWVGEPRPIYPSLTVADNLILGGIIERDQVKVRSERVYELLPMLRAKQRDRAGSLSGGQQQMLAIGQALMSGPQYLCLDEPSMGLAPHVVTTVAELVSELVASGIGVLWAEQYPDVALGRCTRVIVLSSGEVVDAGPADEFSTARVETSYLGGGRTTGPEAGS